MANQKHLKLIRQGVEVWNQWRKNSTELRPNLSRADLRGADLSRADLSRTDLRGANLNLSPHIIRINRDLYGNPVPAHDEMFRRTSLREADLREANLSNADLRGIDLSKADLRGANLKGAIFSRGSLSYSKFFPTNDGIPANLRGADLSGANLSKADLSEAILSNVNLSNALLMNSQLLGSKLTAAILTGACIQNWNVNSVTQLDGVICEYVYLKGSWTWLEQQYLLGDRRPSDPNRIFAPGEFTALFRQALETVDLIFADGIDWQAFFQSFQELRSQYNDENLSIQAIEKKSGGAFVIRLEVPAEADKAAIERQAKELYETRLLLLEERYRVELNAKAQEIEIYKQQNIRMDKIIEILSGGEQPKVTLNEYQIRILQAISNGKTNCQGIAETLGLSLDMTKYYVQEMDTEGYLKVYDSFSGDSIHLTAKGGVALEDPNRLLPSQRGGATSNINNDLRGANIANFANQLYGNASQTATNFSQQYSGQN